MLNTEKEDTNRITERIKAHNIGTRLILASYVLHLVRTEPNNRLPFESELDPQGSNSRIKSIAISSKIRILLPIRIRRPAKSRRFRERRTAFPNFSSVGSVNMLKSHQLLRKKMFSISTDHITALFLSCVHAAMILNFSLSTYKWTPLIITRWTYSGRPSFEP